MDLEELRAFLTVVDKGSFLAAAESLGVARTTLRRRVDALEARAGVPLLESTPHGVVLTDAGRTLATRGKTIVEEASALVSSIRDIGREPSGVLRVVVPSGLPPHVVTAVFGLFRQAWPQLAVHTRTTDRPLDGPLADVDLLVHFGHEVPRGGWTSHEVLRIREWLVASREYVERCGAPTTLAELERHALLAWLPPGEDGLALPTLAGPRVPISPTLVSSDIHFVRQCCLAGFGIALIPDALLPDPGFPADAVVPILPDVVGRHQPLRVTVPTALAELPKIQMVVDATLRFAASL